LYQVDSPWLEKWSGDEATLCSNSSFPLSPRPATLAAGTLMTSQTHALPSWDAVASMFMFCTRCGANLQWKILSVCPPSTRIEGISNFACAGGRWTGVAGDDGLAGRRRHGGGDDDEDARGAPSAPGLGALPTSVAPRGVESVGRGGVDACGDAGGGGGDCCGARSGLLRITGAGTSKTT